MTSSNFLAVVGRLRAAGCVFAEDEAQLLFAQAATAGELDELVRRRVAGLPLEHVLGWAEFAGLRVAVEPGVFVPRHRTELLVREAAAIVRRDASGGVVVDLCCGSGAVGAALVAAVEGAGGAREAGRIELHAADIDPVAVACARRNVGPIGGRVYQGDLYTALPDELRGRVRILIANVPYVPTSGIALLSPEARDYEPHQALDGGADGLDLMRRVAAEAPRWLAPGGSLLVETSSRQVPEALRIMESSGLTPRVANGEEWDATAVVATRVTREPGA